MSSAVKLYKPKSVRTAINILAAGLFLGLIMLGLEYAHFHSGLLETFTPLHQGIAYGALILLLLLVSNGQGWARFLLAAWLLAGVVLGGPVILALFAKYSVLAALAAGQLVLVLAGLVMLFGQRANSWYKG
ncbi:hypothetical protein [Emcibacter sp. SYSU 3D8]|uniref:hypothetical protein n=1 Tax=Emcibacter sp. SYSU 3D8 TaxID=3133969 RepID=UPI0031FEC069